MANDNAYQAKASIDDFKGALQNGGVRPTMYEVQITFPRIIRQMDAFNGGQLTEKFAFLCKASTMPGSQIGQIDVPFRGRKMKVAGDRNFNNWSATVINDNDFYVRGAMEKWTQLIQNYNYAVGVEKLDEYYATALVRQLDRTGNQLRVYQMEHVWPQTIGEIQLSFETQDTIEEYDVEFCYNYWVAGGASAETVKPKERYPGGNRQGGGVPAAIKKNKNVLF